MKRRIEQLLNGIFEYESPKLSVCPERIDASVRRGESVKGSISVENPDQKKVKGFLYAESPRVGFEPAAFSAIKERVVYEIDTTGLSEGETLEGSFTVSSGLGEVNIPYCVRVYGPEYAAEQGTFQSLEEFAAMAQKDFQKAYVFFASNDFKKFLAKAAPEHVLLYNGLIGRALSYQSLEEFLTETGFKEPISIQADPKEITYGVLTQTVQENIVLTKNTWGFLRLDAVSDATFLKIERPIVTTDEFIGSTYTLNYLIDREELHAGKNFGRIMIHSVREDFSFEVMVHGGLNRLGGQNRKEQHRQIEKLYTSYLDYRLNRMPESDCLKISAEAWERYVKAGGAGVMAELFHAHLLFLQGKAEEACLLLDRLEQRKEHAASPESTGYFLYLTTFYNKEKEYLRHVEEKLKELQLRNPESWRITWLLLYVCETYLRHPGQKLEAIRQQFVYGSASRIMYLEAALILQRSPLLLKRLERFEIRVLKLMVKEDLLNPELVMQLVELAGRYRDYNEELFGILAKVYGKSPSKSLLRAILSLLLKGRKKGALYFPWYEKGVEEDVRMTGLYEYFIESMEHPVDKPLPQIIRMYFSYNNTLDYRKKAFVYANVIRNKDKDFKSYQSYRPAMEKFMMDQLLLGHINEDLALLYETFITKSILNKKLAEKLGKLIFTQKVTCEIPWIRYVVVIHGELEGEQRVALKEGQAQIQLYTDNYRIFLEDEEGKRYTSSVSYNLSSMLTEPKFWEYCMELAPDGAGLLLNFCSQKELTGENVKEFCRLLSIEGIREEFQEKIRRRILDFYCHNPREESVLDFLHRIDLRLFVQTDKSKLVRLLVSEGMSREAFSLVSVYGPENVELTSLVNLCRRTVLSMECREDEMLLALCHYCFSHGKYDEIVLSYLLRYYDGPMESMKTLWRAGKNFQADTFILEEKILILVLFMRTGAEDTEEIFDSYRKALGRKMLLKAYVMYRSYDYLVKEISIKEPVFRYIERGYVKGKLSDDVCLLALMKYYARLPELARERQEYVENLLETYTNRGIRLAFFKSFPLAYQRAYQLYDKTFVEYRANPKALINIRYQITSPKEKEGRIRMEPMIHVFEGIFVKEFTLFYGDHLSYQIVEEWNGKNKEACVREEEPQEIDAAGSSQYDLLNQMSKACLEHSLEDAEFAVLQFKEQEALSEGIFTLI